MCHCLHVTRTGKHTGAATARLPCNIERRTHMQRTTGELLIPHATCWSHLGHLGHHVPRMHAVCIGMRKARPRCREEESPLTDVVSTFIH
jgi:hypothetical protein